MDRSSVTPAPPAPDDGSGRRKPRRAAWLERISARFNSDSARTVGMLVSGSFLAQLIAVASLPIITRLYSPTDFSLLAVVAGLIGWIGPTACLRLELAVPLPEREEDGLGLLALALLIALVISTAIAAPVLLAPDPIANGLLRQPQLTPYLWLVPVGAFLYACNAVLLMWFVRTRRFQESASVRIAQAGAAAGAQIGLGLGGFVPLGLLLGPVANVTTASLLLTLRLGRRWLARLAATSLGSMRALLSEYRKFPTLATLDLQFNVAAYHLPIFFIAAAGPQGEAGHLLLALTVMHAPLSLVGAAVSQVFTSRVGDSHRAGDLGRFTTAVLGPLLKFGVGPVLFLGFVAPLLFGVLFGARWQRSGDLILWMLPWMVAQFVAVPLIPVFHVTGNLNLALALQAAGLVIRVALVAAAWFLAGRYMSESYAIAGAIYHLGLLWGVLRCTSGATGDFWLVVRRELPYIALWTAAGLAVRAVAAMRPFHGIGLW